MESLLADGMELKDKPSEPLKLTAFGREFFDQCIPMLGAMPSYRRTPRTYQLYQQLISPYTGSSQNNGGKAGPLAADQVLCLASPVRINQDGTISVDDLVSPFTISLPEAYRDTIYVTLRAMKKEPILKVERLAGVYLSGNPKAFDTLLWMIDAGLILKTIAENKDITSQHIGMKMSTPLLSIQRADPTADALIFG
jgi:hypothetical protein